MRRQAALGSPLVVQEALTAVLTLGTHVGTQGQPGALTLSVWSLEVNIEVLQGWAPSRGLRGQAVAASVSPASACLPVTPPVCVSSSSVSNLPLCLS